MRNGHASLLFSQLPPLMEDLASIADGKLSMPSSTCCEVDAPGDSFLMTCPLGKQCIITFAFGDWMGRGSAFIARCGNAYAFRWDGRPNQAQGLLTAKASKPSGYVDHMAMMLERKSKDANGICSSIHRVCSSKRRCIQPTSW